MRKFLSSSERETKRFARKFAKHLKAGDTVALLGVLGTGKTTFAKGLALGLGLKSRVASPSFVIFNTAKVPGQNLRFYHFDLYRLAGQHDLIELGFSEILQDPQSIVVIEWPEKAKALLPQQTIFIKFQHGKLPTQRIIKVG